MEPSLALLSDVTIHMKYSKFLPDLKRRETWEEIVTRNKNMHLKKFPALATEIEQAYTYVYDKKVLPSMRSMQFGGKPIELSPNRLYNCAYLPIDSHEAFGEIMFLLLGGTGVGYSVQQHHVAQLPDIKTPGKKKTRYLIGDSIEGWADAVKVLVKSYLVGGPTIEFDFSDIRAKGTILKTSGGKAPGPQPLKDCIHNLRKILEAKKPGEKLRPLEVHDMICFIADAVLSGGIRRAALIALFTIDDEEMLTCKFGNWFETNPQRGRANNSAVVVRHKIKKKKFFEIFKKIRASGAGEPGIYFSNNSEWGTNPCQPAWATVLTPTGIQTIGDINIGDTIWSGKQWTKVTNKWSTGIKPVFTYRTTAGFFTGTENHRILSHGEKIEVKDASCIDTAQGICDNLESLDPQDIMDGLIIGDGTVHEASNELVLLTIGKNDSSYHEDKDIKPLIKCHRPGIGPMYWEVETTLDGLEIPLTYKRFVPEQFKLNVSSKKMRGFLRGLYSANGSVVGNRVTLKASSFTIIHDVQIMLSSLGIRSYYTTNKEKTTEFKNGNYVCKESYDLNISTDRDKFAQLIGFIQPYKTSILHKIIDTVGKSIYANGKSKSTYDIISITSDGEHEVFDLTVEADEHTYWTGGLLVSNCCEIGLRAFQFCNLTTTNVSDVTTQEELNNRVRAAAFIGTLQASYTNFHYLRPIWQETTEKEALIGVSMTGIASGGVLKLDCAEAAKIVKKENKRIALLIGINPAARCTAIKPEGTGSCVVGSCSGIHAWDSPYYIRRIRVNKNESIYKYMAAKIPELVEDDYFKPTTDAILMIPIKAPEGSIFKTEPAIELLERVKFMSTTWVKNGHRKGDNTHNVSATISVKDDEWDTVGNWMWDNKKFYNGLTVLPFDGGNYIQAPFTECSEYEYNIFNKFITQINLSEILEDSDYTNLTDQAACAGGMCER